MKKIARSAIKSVDIAESPERVYDFLSDPMNWPQYAVVNLKSVSPGRDGWFKAVTKFGEGEIKISGVKELGGIRPYLERPTGDVEGAWTNGA